MQHSLNFVQFFWNTLSPGNLAPEQFAICHFTEPPKDSCSLSHPGFILARVVRVKNENGRIFTRKK